MKYSLFLASVLVTLFFTVQLSEAYTVKIDLSTPGSGSGQVTFSATSSPDIKFTGWSGGPGELFSGWLSEFGGSCEGKKGHCALGGLIRNSSKKIIANFDPNTCDQFIYSPPDFDFNKCGLDGRAYRTLIAAGPPGCVGGNPVTSWLCTAHRDPPPSFVAFTSVPDNEHTIKVPIINPDTGWAEFKFADTRCYEGCVSFNPPLKLVNTYREEVVTRKVDIYRLEPIEVLNGTIVNAKITNVAIDNTKISAIDKKGIVTGVQIDNNPLLGQIDLGTSKVTPGNIDNTKLATNLEAAKVNAAKAREEYVNSGSGGIWVYDHTETVIDGVRLVPDGTVKVIDRAALNNIFAQAELAVAGAEKNAADARQISQNLSHLAVGASADRDPNAPNLIAASQNAIINSSKAATAAYFSKNILLEMQTALKNGDYASLKRLNDVFRDARLAEDSAQYVVQSAAIARGKVDEAPIPDTANDPPPCSQVQQESESKVVWYDPRTWFSGDGSDDTSTDARLEKPAFSEYEPGGTADKEIDANLREIEAKQKEITAKQKEIDYWADKYVPEYQREELNAELKELKSQKDTLNTELGIDFNLRKPC